MSLLAKMRRDGAYYACLLSWVVAFFLSVFVSFVGYIGTGFAPMQFEVPRMLALPAVLVGLASFRWSAITTGTMVIWDAVVLSWPKIALTDLFALSQDMTLTIIAGLMILMSLASPFASVRGALWAMEDD